MDFYLVVPVDDEGTFEEDPEIRDSFEEACELAKKMKVDSWAKYDCIVVCKCHEVLSY